MNTGIRSIVLATVGLCSLAATVTMGVARAQEQAARTGATIAEQQYAPQAQPGWPGQGEPMPPMGGQMPPMQQMRPGGQVTMIQDGNNLFVLRGNEIFRVAKDTLQVLAVGHLPEPKPMNPPMGQGTRPAPQGGGGGRGGGDEKK